MTDDNKKVNKLEDPNRCQMAIFQKTNIRDPRRGISKLFKPIIASEENLY